MVVVGIMSMLRQRCRGVGPRLSVLQRRRGGAGLPHVHASRLHRLPSGMWAGKLRRHKKKNFLVCMPGRTSLGANRHPSHLRGGIHPCLRLCQRLLPGGRAPQHPPLLYSPGAHPHLREERHSSKLSRPLSMAAACCCLPTLVGTGPGRLNINSSSIIIISHPRERGSVEEARALGPLRIINSSARRPTGTRLHRCEAQARLLVSPLRELPA